MHRATSAVVDAYLTPILQAYIRGFFDGFDEGLSFHGNSNTVDVKFMQSDGGLTSVNSFSGFRAILSGPAAGTFCYNLLVGVVGYGVTSFDSQEQIGVIGFDMVYNPYDK